MEDKNTRPTILLARLEETAGLGSDSPTAMLGLSPESEGILSVVTAFLKEGRHTIEEVGSLITAEDAQKVAEDYLRLQKEAEAHLYAFVDSILLEPLRIKQPGAIQMNYHVEARCPVIGERYENNAHIDHAKLERYRGLEYRLADEIAVCPSCLKPHQADVSFMEYTLWNSQFTFSRLEQAVLKAQKVVDAAEKSGQNTRKLQKAEERLKSASKTLEEFTKDPLVLRVSARVKGSESLVYKIVDKVTRLDELVPDEQKRSDTRLPTAVKDYLGVHVYVLCEAGKDWLLSHIMEQSQKMPENLRVLGGKNYWDPPKKDLLPDGREVEMGRKENPDGTIRHDGYHLILMYVGMPIEVQVIRLTMKAAHDEDHEYHRERLRRRRRILQEEYGIPHMGYVKLFQELLQPTEHRLNLTIK
jgi:hypothetical protein